MRIALPPAGRLIPWREPWARLRRCVQAWSVSAPAVASASVAEAPAAPATAGPKPPEAARATLADRLWGAGFTLPGGEAEVLRLAHLLPLSPATTLLLLGRDAGGAARAIAEHRRAWVAAHQHDPALAERMAPLLRAFGKRATVQPWDPRAPGFRARFHHHALVLEAMQSGAAPPLLAQALAAALKPSAQLVMLDLVAEAPGAGFDRWLALDGRKAPPPARRAVEEALVAAGFTLHVTESLGTRQSAAATEGWTRLLASLRDGGRPIGGPEAGALVTEAEAWLLRHRLIATGALAVLRWHATLRG